MFSAVGPLRKRLYFGIEKIKHILKYRRLEEIIKILNEERF